MQRLALDYFLSTKDRHPDRTALVDASGAITYAGLWREAAALGWHIKQAVPGPRRPVVVAIDKSSAAVAAILAVQLAGHIYVPFDVASPAARRAAVWRLLDDPPVVEWDGADFRVAGRTVALDYDPAQAAALLRGLAPLTGLDPLYIIFTSGTTGEPKGVTIANAAVIDYIDWVVATYQIHADEIIGSQAPLYFDNSVLDLYASFATGATLHLIPKRDFRFLSDLVAYLETRRISLVFFVPSLLANIAAFDLFSGRNLASLRKVLFAGEAMPLNTLKYLREKLPNALLSNLYGPTEITVDAIFHIFGEDLAGLDAVPLGLPCANSKIIFLDDAGRVVAEPDTVAEICVGGIGVSLGYWNNPEQTQAAFIQHPGNPHCREILYRTGDYGYRSGRDGLIYFVGRRDHQIKHLGHRIELGEIETALGRIDGIQQCCALYDRAGQRILACYTAAGGQPLPDLRKQLAACLPAYMMPQTCQYLDRFPVTPNGKIDRETLLAGFSSPA